MKKKILRRLFKIGEFHPNMQIDISYTQEYLKVARGHYNEDKIRFRGAPITRLTKEELETVIAMLYNYQNQSLFWD